MPGVWIEKRQTKRGIRRYIRTRRADGTKDCAPAGPYLKTAIKIRNKIQERILHQRHGLGNPNLTVGGLTQEFIEESKKSLKPSTVRIYDFALRPFAKRYGDLKVIDLTTPLFERFKLEMLGSNEVNGVDIILRCLRACLAYAVRVGYLDINPVKGLKFPKPEKVARYLSSKEKKALVQAAGTNPELRLIIRMALQTGMRLGEILKARHEDIRGGHIHVHQEKTGKPKIVTLHPRLLKMLGRRQSGMIFPGWSVWRLERAFRRAVARARIGRVRFHDLRHTFASDYLKKGGTVLDLKAQMGVTLQTLDVYSHFQQRDLDRKIDRMEFI